MVVQDNGIAVEPRVVVVGVGGAGCNVVSTFYETMCPIDTIAINTDKAALGKTSADEKLYICKDVLHEEGARGEQILGKRCADIHKDEIRQALHGAQQQRGGGQARGDPRAEPVAALGESIRCVSVAE